MGDGDEGPYFLKLEPHPEEREFRGEWPGTDFALVGLAPQITNYLLWVGDADGRSIGIHYPFQFGIQVITDSIARIAKDAADLDPIPDATTIPVWVPFRGPPERAIQSEGVEIGKLPEGWVRIHGAYLVRP